MEDLGVDPGRPGQRAFGRRGAPRGAGPGPRADARHPAARRADQPSRSSGDRMAGEGACANALRLRADQPRQAPARRSDEATVWLDRGATRRLDQGFAAFEAWRDQMLEEEEAERHKLDRRIVDGGALDALRRHRAAQAQHAPRRRTRPDAPGAARGAARPGRRNDGRPGGAGLGRAGDRGRR